MLSLETDVVPGHSTGHTPSLFTEFSCGNEEKDSDPRIFAGQP